MQPMLELRAAALCFCLVISIPGRAETVEKTALTDQDAHSLLAKIAAMHRIDRPREELGVRVFELGGGDPAMNGAHLFVCIDYKDQTRVWSTGLNVRKIKSIAKAPGNALVLTVLEDVMDAGSRIVLRQTAYTLRFRIEGGALRDALTVEKRRPGGV